MNSAELLLGLVPGNVVFYPKRSDKPKSNNLDGDISKTTPKTGIDRLEMCNRCQSIPQFCISLLYMQTCDQ